MGASGLQSQPDSCMGEVSLHARSSPVEMRRSGDNGPGFLPHTVVRWATRGSGRWGCPRSPPAPEPRPALPHGGSPAQFSAASDIGCLPTGSASLPDMWDRMRVSDHVVRRRRSCALQPTRPEGRPSRRPGQQALAGRRCVPPRRPPGMTGTSRIRPASLEIRAIAHDAAAFRSPASCSFRASDRPRGLARDSPPTSVEPMNWTFRRADAHRRRPRRARPRGRC